MGVSVLLLLKRKIHSFHPSFPQNPPKAHGRLLKQTSRSYSLSNGWGTSHACSKAEEQPLPKSWSRTAVPTSFWARCGLGSTTALTDLLPLASNRRKNMWKSKKVSEYHGESNFRRRGISDFTHQNFNKCIGGIFYYLCFCWKETAVSYNCSLHSPV